MFGYYELGTERYEARVEEYANLFKKYGYTVTRPDKESLMVEKDNSIGAFTIREDGLVAGAFYNSFRKEELMAGFEKEKANCNRWKARMGWFFYEYMNRSGEGYGNHDFSMGEVEWALQRRSA